jgi:hypothetical protein
MQAGRGATTDEVRLPESREATIQHAPQGQIARSSLIRTYSAGCPSPARRRLSRRQGRVRGPLPRVPTSVKLQATVRLWKVHTLTGDRKGTWSLSVTGNRRLTFRIDDEGDICDVNLED